jgi:hypothetical protein
VNRALTEHLQAMLARFGATARRAYKNNLHVAVFMWKCAKMAFDRATEAEERRFWRGYIKNVEASIERQKRENEERAKR